MRLYQYAITEDAFKYYEDLKKNTEGLGSIFDPQPSLTTGNIRCLSNPAERVLGFVSASTVSAKIFSLRYEDLPLTVKPMNPGDCKISDNPCLNNFTKYVGPPDSIDCNDTYNGKIEIEPQNTFSQRLRSLYATRSYQLIITGPDYGIVNGVRQIVSYKYFKRDCVDCLAMPGSENATYDRPSYFPAFQ
jgi:hypothetical protein